jgi:hypothetical protein
MIRRSVRLKSLPAERFPDDVWGISLRWEIAGHRQIDNCLSRQMGS